MCANKRSFSEWDKEKFIYLQFYGPFLLIVSYMLSFFQRKDAKAQRLCPKREHGDIATDLLENARAAEMLIVGKTDKITRKDVGKTDKRV